MSRYATTEYNRYERVRARACNVYSLAITCRMTHTDILARMVEIYDSADCKKLTTAYRFGLSATVRVLSDNLWQTHLEWRLGPAEGPLPEPHQDAGGEGKPLSILCRIPGALYGGHYWKGTNRPFTEYKPTN
jgi:hypothetical protein